MSLISYKDAGVDINAGNETIQRIKPLVEKTFSSHVHTEIGAFGSLYDLKALLASYQHPLLVQSIDGVGTKSMIARQMQKFDTLGMDLVSATANDIVVMGATPVTLLDYIAADKLHPHVIEQIILGMVQACCAHNISLVGGETAEMPGVYRSQEYDLVGIVTGIVEKEKVILGKDITAGDVVLGISSSGLHTNGYSLARKLFLETSGFKIDSYYPELERTIGEALLEPHLNYTRPILYCLQQGLKIKGMAHITGGGFIDNIPRILPSDCGVEIRKTSWSTPPIFSILKQLGQLEENEMFRTFNMGIGLIMIMDEITAEEVKKTFRCFPEFALHSIGHVYQAKRKEVRIL